MSKATDDARHVLQDFDEEEHEGVSVLRKLNAKMLGPSYLDRPMVIHHHSKPIVVLVPYGLFMRAQDALEQMQRELGERR